MPNARFHKSNFVYDQAEDRLVWWSFAGRFLNEAFATLLENAAGIEARFDDYHLRLPHETDGSEVKRILREALADPDTLRNLPISKQWLDGLKFSECLPETLAAAAARGRVQVSDETVEAIRLSISQPRAATDSEK